MVKITFAKVINGVRNTVRVAFPSLKKANIGITTQREGGWVVIEINEINEGKED